MGTRHERVVLDLEDNLTPGALRAAAAVGVLDKSLNGLNDRNVAVARSVQSAVPQIDRVGASARKSAVDIDTLSGRVSVLADVLLALGPAALPIAAVAVPAITTLAGAAMAAGVGAGSMAIAFQGVGDALETMNKAKLDPTKQNLEAARVAMERLAPAAQAFVAQIDSMRGLGAGIRDAGAQALFPGLTEALETIESRGPEVTRIVAAFNAELGDIAGDAATSLASDRWDDFFRMVEREGPRTLDPLARAIGDVAHGASEIMEAFAPLNRDGMDWIESAADGFDRWATGLKQTDGFKEFVAYIRENGPQVAETVAALSDALVAIATALAEVGPHSLRAIEGVANAVAAVASSDMAGPLLAAIAAMRVINRLAPVTAASMAMVSGGAGVGGAAAGAAAGAAGGRGGRRFPGGRGGAVAAGILGVGAVDQLMEGNSIAEWFGDSGRSAGKALGTDKVPGWVKGKLDIIFDVDANTVPAENKIDALKVEVRRLNGVKGTAKADLDARAAKLKQREQDDWIMSWGRKNARAKADLDDRQAQARGRAVDAMLNGIDRKRAHPTASLNDQASGPLGGVLGLLGRVDGYHATSSVTNTITTQYRVVRSVTDALPDRTPSADGGFVPKSGLPYADRYPYLLADGEGVTTNRRGETDRFRDVVAGINKGLSRAQVKDMLGNGGFAGRSSHSTTSAPAFPSRLVLETDIGPIVARVADSRIDAQSRWEREQAR